jgi:hypothetical protein
MVDERPRSIRTPPSCLNDEREKAAAPVVLCRLLCFADCGSGASRPNSVSLSLFFERLKIPASGLFGWLVVDG